MKAWSYCKYCAIFVLIVYALSSSMAMATSEGRAKDVRHVYRRTAAVLRVAQRFASASHINYGLGLAIIHHRYSEKLYHQGRMDDAIYHSLRARSIAANVIRQNKSEILQEALHDQMESRYAQRSPSEKELDRRVRGEKPLSDEAAETERFSSDLQ